MTMKIYKYKLPITNDLIEIEMPLNSKILTIQNQNDDITIWVLHDLSFANHYTKRKFKIYGTGHHIGMEYSSACYSYIGTVQIVGFVWHIFEIHGDF